MIRPLDFTSIFLFSILQKKKSVQIIAESIDKNRNFIITIVLCTINIHMINQGCKKQVYVYGKIIKADSSFHFFQ
jgi:ABC-type methionine transport system ATPase subunit